ncbi:MAG: hypothetical protein WBD24_06260 [Candidatus Omnitrophota bacterium]
MEEKTGSKKKQELNESSGPDALMVESSREVEKKWFYNPWAIVTAILFFGPLALPLVWYRPRTKLYLKVLISVVVIILTVWMIQETIKVFEALMLYYKELADVLK